MSFASLLSARHSSALQRGASVAVLLLCAIVAAPAAQASAIYSTSAEATLTIGGFTAGSGFTIAGTAAPVPDAPDFATFKALLFTGFDLSGAYAFGDATAGKSAAAQVNAADDPNAMVAGDSLHQSASVSGSAVSRNDYSVALQMTTGVLTLTNNSGADVSVNFTLDYLWSISAAVGDFLNEFAESFFNIRASLWLDNDFIGDLFVLGDQPGQYVQTWTDGNLTSLGNAGSATFSVLVPNGSIGMIGLFVDAEGYAEVPAPGSLALLGFALAGLGFARRRHPIDA